jgi:thiamine biosynthesis lipoprotein
MGPLGTATWQQLGTRCETVVAEPALLRAALSAVQAELDEADRAASRFREDSELFELNRHAGHWHPVGPWLFTAIQEALGAAWRTGSLVDPTVGAALVAAGYDADFDVVRRRPPAPPVEVATPVPGWRSVEVDPERRAVRLAPGTLLDLGATAKALAADRAAERAARLIGSGVLVSLGGDLAVAGDVPPGGWPVRVSEDCRSSERGDPVVAVLAGGLATSSTVLRRWRHGAGWAHHVIDPRTGQSSKGPWRTVTVSAATCVQANTASTAALLLGDDAPAWLERHGLAARLVAGDGTATTVGPWPAPIAARAAHPSRRQRALVR